MSLQQNICWKQRASRFLALFQPGIDMDIALTTLRRVGARFCRKRCVQGACSFADLFKHTGQQSPPFMRNKDANVPLGEDTDRRVAENQ